MPLEETVDGIGTMSLICPHCGAKKFKGEPPSSCCLNGQIRLDVFPRPPAPIMDLWMGNDAKSRIFREHSRIINNSVCLSSLQVQERKAIDGFNPSVIFEGKVMHRVGSIGHAAGETPRYAQLYVLDSAMELTQRFANMYVPTSLSSNQKKLLKQCVEVVQNAIHSVNPFVADFKQIMEIPVEDLAEGKIIISAEGPADKHKRTYNLPTNLKEVSIVTNSQPNDMVLHQRGGGLKTISNLNPCGMPFHFTLLFPHGSHGWDKCVSQADGKRRITPRQFFCFHLNLRGGINQDFLHRAGRLFQEWICMSWVLVEDQRLFYQEQNQKALRADTYTNVKEFVDQRKAELAPREDGVYADDHQKPVIGRKILSASFTGGPRWYNAKFQDAMAIVAHYHKPDLFITVTTNPKWKEITDELIEGQHPQDRPDVVARVFKKKCDQLMKDLTKGGIFGKAVAWMSVIEFQKRGLPHCHILLILAQEDRMLTPDLVNKMVVAELPPDPDSIENPALRDQCRRLQDIVCSNMLHGPCGKENPKNVCMVNGQCSKAFPKEFIKETVVDPASYYAIYQRRSPQDGGRVLTLPDGRKVDNSFVVPYNPLLLLRYNCHINVELCSSPKAAKYLFKYVTKGSDRAMVQAEVVGGNGQPQPRDEIGDYQDMRCVGSSEAVWHLLNYDITSRFPAVKALKIHLKDQQQVNFDMEQEEEALEKNRDTELTAFFNFNAQRLAEGAEPGSLPKYVDMVQEHTYNLSTKTWTKRKQESATIGRIHSVNPVAGDIFYLRMLLNDSHCQGKVSFEDMRRLLSGKVCETYKETAFELGLLSEDMEWVRVLEVAENTGMPVTIRDLFVIILMFCNPSSPRQLFDQFWPSWSDDFEQKAIKQGSILSETQKKTLVLLDLETKLQSFEKSLQDFGLPVPTPDELASVSFIANTMAAVIREELQFNVQELAQMVEERLPTFTQEQRQIFDVVMEHVNAGKPFQAFINARGGSGKTYLLNTILAAIRSRKPGGCVALAMATTGIAAVLLSQGRTLHSRLKLPLDLNEHSTLQISFQSMTAELIRMADALICDEATMMDNLILDCIDRSMRDIMQTPNLPFGGKIFLLSGDFRQCLPVIPGANRATIVRHCLNQSHLWPLFTQLKLTQNMRVLTSGDEQLETFDAWTLGIGNGMETKVQIPQEMIATRIIPNTKENPNSEGAAMKEFCSHFFPSLETNYDVEGFLDGRVLLATTNKEVEMLNETVSSMMPGEGIVLKSSDELENSQDLLRFNTEYLNSLKPGGFPPHCLILKPRTPIMLLRNLDPKNGLCNGTRLLFLGCLDNKLLRCRVLSNGKIVLIPRIVFIPKVNAYPFNWSRRQYPVKVNFACTINKSQGQTLRHAGLWLRSPAFTHGQLYVGVSRVGSQNRLKFAIYKSEETENIVFHEVLI